MTLNWIEVSFEPLQATTMLAHVHRGYDVI